MIAAFLLVIGCAMAPAPAGSVPQDACQSFEAQKWEGPTADELEDCAGLAEELRILGKKATCEVVPMSESAVEYEKLGVDLRRNDTYWRDPDHRTKWGGNLVQREFDQPNYIF